MGSTTNIQGKLVNPHGKKAKVSKQTDVITSIEEELIKYLKDEIIAKDYLFHSGGREDIDVRMLGIGRPFILECVGP